VSTMSRQVGIGAAGKAQRVTKAGTGKSDGEPVFVEMVVKEAGKSDGASWGRCEAQADGVVMLLRAEQSGRAPIFSRIFTKAKTRGSS